MEGKIAEKDRKTERRMIGGMEYSWLPLEC